MMDDVIGCTFGKGQSGADRSNPERNDGDSDQGTGMWEEVDAF